MEFVVSKVISPYSFYFKILGNCNGDKWSEWAPFSPYETKDLLKFWSHDIEGDPLDIKNDPSSSKNPSTQNPIQSTVKEEGIYVDSLQQPNYNQVGENLYELPQEIESSTTKSTQSSSKTYDYNENEGIGYGIVSNERGTSVKPSPSQDQNYPEYNPESINAILPQDKKCKFYFLII